MRSVCNSNKVQWASIVILNLNGLSKYKGELRRGRANKVSPNDFSICQCILTIMLREYQISCASPNAQREDVIAANIS